MNILITGASRGIGSSLKLLCEQSGNKVIDFSRSTKVDITKETQVIKAISKISVPLDVIVLNAGICNKAHALKSSSELLEHFIVNVLGNYTVLKYAITGKLCTSATQVIFILSNDLNNPPKWEGYMAYQVSKRAFEEFGKYFEEHYPFKVDFAYPKLTNTTGFYDPNMPGDAVSVETTAKEIFNLIRRN